MRLCVLRVEPSKTSHDYQDCTSVYTEGWQVGLVKPDFVN